MSGGGRLRWAGLALLGLAVAAGVAIAASSLASREIGLSSESIKAGDTLAPALTSRLHRRGSERAPARRAPAQPKPVTPPPEPLETTPAPAPAPAEEARTPEPGGGDDGGGGEAGGEPADD